MKIMISGIAGFLGANLAEYFLNEGHQVTGFDNLFGGERENLPLGVQFYYGDITEKPENLVHLMEGCDLIFHCAATPYEGVSNFAPGYICNNIYSGSVNVFTAAIMADIKRIVNCSSMARYGDIATPYEETDIPQPTDPYGIAKEAAERTLKNLSETHGIEYVTAVPHNIYGPKQRYIDPYRNVASIFINLMLQNRQPIIYGDGKQTRCFSYVTDCISCLAAMGTQNNVTGETINIGPDEEFVTINELAERIAKIIGFKLDPIYMPDRPREVKHAVCSSDKARELLGYETKVSLDEGLTKLIEWIDMKGPKPFEYHFELEIINEKTPSTWKDCLF